MMRGKITGVDISVDRVSAVQVTEGLKGYQIISCAAAPVGDGGVEETLESLAGTLDPRSDIYSVSIPEDRISFRNLPIPFNDPKKIRQALPFEMETMLPFQAEDLMVDFIITNAPDQNEVLAASCDRGFIAEYLKLLQLNGINPGSLEVRGAALASCLLRQQETPDHIIVLDVGEKTSTMVLCLERRIALIRAFPTGLTRSSEAKGGSDIQVQSVDVPGGEIGFSLEPLCGTVRNTVHAFLSRREGLPLPERIFLTGPGSLYSGMDDLLGRSLGIGVEKIDLCRDKKFRLGPGAVDRWSPALMDGALSLALGKTRKDEGFNFRRGEFERRKRYSGFRRAFPGAAVFLVLILAFLTADFLVDYHALREEYHNLTTQINSLFKQTLPRVTRIVDPVQQLRVEIQKLRKSSPSSESVSEKPVLELLREISERVPRTVRVHIDRMVIDPETVRLSGRTDAFNQVDRIKNSLESSGYFRRVVISSANLDRTGEGVRFDIRVYRKGSEGSK